VGVCRLGWDCTNNITFKQKTLFLQLLAAFPYCVVKSQIQEYGSGGGLKKATEIKIKAKTKADLYRRA